MDVNKIELDSQLNYSLTATTTSTSNDRFDENKIWKVVQRYDARSSQELSVTPGMLVYVIKEFLGFVYARLIGYEDANAVRQQYGMLPRECVVNLGNVFAASQMNGGSAINENNLNEMGNFDVINSSNNNNKRRKSQITAL